MTEGLENLPAPPPLPERDRRPGLWCWPVIVGAVLAIALMPYLDSAAREQTETEDGLSQLAVLQLQSRLLIGLSAIDRAQVAKELDELNELITDDRSAAAVALVHAFVGEKEGREKAVAILERQAGEEGGETPLTEWARKALDVGVTPAERAMLSQHLGWFAHLMPASGEDGGGAVPRADEIRRSGLISMFITAGLTLLVILALMTGVILLVYVLARKRRGEFSTAFDRTRLPARVFLESFAIFMAAIGLGSVGGLFLNPLVQIALVLGGLACGLLWPRIRGLSWRETRKSLGWHRGRGFFREVGAGAAGYIAMLPIALAGIGISALLASLAPSESMAHPAVGGMLGDWPQRIFLFVLAAVFAPLMEETVFRGAFYRSLRFGNGVLIAGLVNGVIFAALHPQGWMGIPALTAMGFGFALIREWRDSLIAPMTAHAINNGLLVGGLALLLD